MTNTEAILNKFFHFQQRPATFITYYGDIYFGILKGFHNYPDGAFIFPLTNFRKLNDLKYEDQTLEFYKQNAWEIKDVNIIKDVIPENSEKANFLNSNEKTNSFQGQQFKRLFVF